MAERGFGGVSVDEIAERAGYSRGAFYANFPNKEAALVAVLREHMENEIAEITAILDAPPGSPAVVERLEAWMRASHTDADWALLSAEMQLHALRSAVFGEQYAALQRDHRRALGKILSLLFAHAGRALPADATSLAATIKALAQGLALQNALHTGDEAAVDSMRMIRLVIQALIQTAPPAEQP